MRANCSIPFAWVANVFKLSTSEHLEAFKMQSREIVAIAAFAFVIAFCPGGSAQTSTPNSSPGASEPPANNMPAPNRDLSGVWYMMRGNYDTASFSKGDPPMSAWGREQFNAAKPSQGPRGVPLSETNDKVYQCYSPGMPYIYLQLFPLQIVETPTEVIELFESDHSVRHIFLDRSTHPDAVTPSYMGDSIGHWEGDTLVVDTVGLNGKTWLDRVGHPNSEQMHIVEHIRRSDKSTLQVDFLFDDPKSYTKPWTAVMRFRLHPDWHIIEDMCMDNKAFESFEK
jgi:hypothetical protein